MNTSYFAKLKLIETPLSICGKAPDWYSGPQFKVLAPKYDFFTAYKNKEIDEAEYTVQFKERVLAPLDPKEIFNKLVRRYGHDVTLMCYEKSTDFCHRHLVAQWLSNGNHIVIRELFV